MRQQLWCACVAYRSTTIRVAADWLIVQEYFWNALDSFSEEDKARFLVFVWGRSRLPVSDATFTQKFTLDVSSSHGSDMSLPGAHTCFFELDLPPYSTETIAHDKVANLLLHQSSVPNLCDADLVCHP